MGQESVCHGSDLVVSSVNNEPVWVRYRVLIIPSNNIEVFPEGEESLSDEIQYITSRIRLIKIIDALQKLDSEVTGRRRIVYI